METEVLLYEGKAKKMFKTPDSDVLRVVYLDQATALNGARKDQIQGKAALNNQITALIFEQLNKKKIHSHFIRKISKHEQLVEKLTIIPLEVVVRNVAAGSFSKRLGVKEGTPLSTPIVEFYYKNDSLDDPMINEDHIHVLNLATAVQVAEIKEQALKINQVLLELFAAIEIRLVDFKIEFGKRKDGRILLADEITPDTCRLWDKKTANHLDKDVYRRNLGELVPVYQEVLSRLEQQFC